MRSSFGINPARHKTLIKLANLVEAEGEQKIICPPGAATTKRRYYGVFRTESAYNSLELLPPDDPRCGFGFIAHHVVTLIPEGLKITRLPFPEMSISPAIWLIRALVADSVIIPDRTEMQVERVRDRLIQRIPNVEWAEKLSRCKILEIPETQSVRVMQEQPRIKKQTRRFATVDRKR